MTDGVPLVLVDVRVQGHYILMMNFLPFTAFVEQTRCVCPATTKSINRLQWFPEVQTFQELFWVPSQSLLSPLTAPHGNDLEITDIFEVLPFLLGLFVDLRHCPVTKRGLVAWLSACWVAVMSATVVFVHSISVAIETIHKVLPQLHFLPVATVFDISTDNTCVLVLQLLGGF